MTLTGEGHDRYARHLQLAEVGEEGQRSLGEARVLIWDLAGAGQAAACYLVAAGVGTVAAVVPAAATPGGILATDLQGALGQLIDLNPEVAVRLVPRDQARQQVGGCDMVIALHEEGVRAARKAGLPVIGLRVDGGTVSLAWNCFPEPGASETPDLAPAAGVAGSLAACEAIKGLLDRGRTLDRPLVWNLWDAEGAVRTMAGEQAGTA